MKKILLFFMMVNTCQAQYPCILKRVDMLGCSTFADLVHKTESVFNALGQPNMTLFVPTDAAFDALPAAISKQLYSNTTYLTEIFSYHVVHGVHFSRSLMNDMLLPTLIKQQLRINIYSHVNYPHLANKTKSSYFAGGSQIGSPDNDATNGVVHTVNSVITDIPHKSILDIIEQDMQPANFSRLAQLMIYVGPTLTKYLSDETAKTLFAPTNEAIAALPPGALYYWQHNHTAFEEVLQYHLLEHCFFTDGLRPSDGHAQFMTRQGSKLNVSVTLQGEVHLNPISKVPGPMKGYNNADVTTHNIAATNGVIQAIDRVLLPPQ